MYFVFVYHGRLDSEKYEVAIFSQTPPHPLPLFRGIRCLGPETESRGRLFPDSGSSRSQKLFPSCLAQKIPIFADISAAACVSNRKGNKGIKIGGLSNNQTPTPLMFDSRVPLKALNHYCHFYFISGIHFSSLTNRSAHLSAN